MKKVLSILAIVAIVAMIATTSVKATTNSELPDALYNIGKDVGMTASDKVRIERYLSDYPVTEEQANQVVANAEKAAAIMNGKNIDELTAEEIADLKAIANSTASVIGVTIEFKAGSAEIYKNGKLIEKVTVENGKLAYTGNEINAVLVVSAVAVIALVTVVIARKKFVNA